jgi:subtilisin family serine protease
VWNLDRVDQESLPLSGTFSFPADAGSGATVYVVDTGVRLTHREFAGRAKSGYDFVDDDADASDCNGHGTHVAGTVAGATFGVAKRAQVVAVRVLDCDGEGTNSQVIAGIDWVTKHAVKPAVANLSLGGDVSQAIDAAVRRSIAAGITYAVAAGNDDVDACTASPARVPDAITVGATDRTDKRASFSNHGRCLDLFAPGAGIRSASYSGDRSTEILDGTSMATPHVAGAIALYLAEHRTATPAQVRAALLKAATANELTYTGAGSPNRLLNVTGL